MNLAEFQRQMEEGITAPSGCKRSAPRLRAAAGLIKPNSRLTAQERLEIYRRSYWARLLDSLAEDFPGLQAVLGKRGFRRLSETYLEHSPSRSFTLRDLGSQIVNFLRDHPGYAGSQPQLALDMASLEWAHIEAYDSPVGAAIGPEGLVGLDTSVLRLGLQPHLQLLEVKHPVDEWLIRIQSCSEEYRVRLLRNLSKSSRFSPNKIFMAVHRVNESVYYRRLASGEYRILSALQAGHSIEDALAESEIHDAALIEAWFASWSLSGWLCGHSR